MKERGILFSAPMVRALLDGRKTQTRRLVNPRLYLIVDGDEDTGRVVDQSSGQFGACAEEYAPCPYGQPGDRLWVRETWCHAADQDRYYYRADELDVRAIDTTTHEEVKRAPWKPSIHMPRRASRITLEITHVRVQRLQEISEEDAKAEGVTPFPRDPEGDCWTDGKHRTAFEYLWNEIHGFSPNAFGLNPWVWAVTFKQIEVPNG